MNKKVAISLLVALALAIAAIFYIFDWKAIKSTLDDLDSLITIIAVLIALAQFLYSKNLENKNLRLQFMVLNQTKISLATDLFIKHNELNITHYDENDHRLNETSKTFWLNNALLAIAESIFNTVGKDVEWRSTVKWMIKTQIEYIKATELDFSTYSPGFKQIIEEVKAEKPITKLG